MLFNSLEFVFLVLTTMAVYYAWPRRGFQVAILIAASFVFYAANQPALLLLLMASIAVNVLSSHAVAHGRAEHRRLRAGLGVVVNLAILASFKYSPLAGRTFFSGDDPIAAFLIAMPLPVGISFFTFQGITLLVDTFREKTAGDSTGEKSDSSHTESAGLVPASLGRHAMDTAFFISFFPQLVAGPIMKAREFLPQVGVKYLRDVDWEYCARALIIGYFLKMVIADNLRNYTFYIAHPYYLGASGPNLIAFVLGFSMEIFADFAGYSLIAIGTAGLFGYRLKKNFDFPYIALSFSEFWRRWHISLSSFLKEYLYIPLGGNRRGALLTYLNLFMVMFLGGLWHGAAWSFAVWGMVHGLALALERLLGGARFTLPSFPGAFIINYFRGLLVFSVVTIAWLFFLLPFEQVLEYLRMIYVNRSRIPDFAQLNYIALYCLPVVLYHAYYLYRRSVAEGARENRLRRFEPYALGILLLFIITNAGPTKAFIYFQF